MDRIKVNAVLHAVLVDGQPVYGTVDKISEGSFLLDDNVTGDVIAINFSEIKEIISID